MTNKIVIDFHGVLTDGKLNISHDGKTFFESVHVRDTRAMRELIALGYEVYIVTQSDSPIIDAYCQKVGCEKLVLRDKSKIPFMYDFAVGDDVSDLEMINRAMGYGYCPRDADPLLREKAQAITLETNGGRGVIAELVPILIKEYGRILSAENERQQAQ